MIFVLVGREVCNQQGYCFDLFRGAPIETMLIMMVVTGIVSSNANSSIGLASSVFLVLFACITSYCTVQRLGLSRSSFGSDLAYKRVKEKEREMRGEREI